MRMRSNVLTVMKKELRRFFGDRRMVLTMLLPGLLIFVLYSVMGDTLVKGLMTPEDYVYTVTAEHMPASVQAMLDGADLPLTVSAAPGGDADAVREAVREGTVDLYVVFPPDFDSAVAVYDPQSGTPAPEVRIYYNSSSSQSSGAYSVMTSLLDSYESALTNRFDINRSTDTAFDLATPEDTTGMFLSMLMPMLLLMLLFSGCMAVAPESIAGEKERGTLATLLVTPLRRSELAFGKIAALSLVAMVSGTWSFLGVMLSLPKLMGGEEAGLVDTGMYGVADYACLLAVILSTILVFVSLISVLSALARSVKEASGMVTPLMILVMLVSFGGMLFPNAQAGTLGYLIPVYNSAQCISGIFSLSYQPVEILLTLLSNAALTALLVLLLARLFNSEKVMFKR